MPEFSRGLVWLLGPAGCPGCKDLGGLERGAIRDCATTRKQDYCYECPDHESCRDLIFVQGKG